MSYQVLARRWRPLTFDAVVGQAPIVRTLRNALAQERIAHAYLFAGPRGVGKTTTARLLAMGLNCEGVRAGGGVVPCATCEPCREVAAGRALDVIEIDGASNRGIDEVRTLRENARYAPARGRRKVYIIDEVHMLTEPAFNALLKTLEEPPAHVVFVLATTEARRLPPTILSRCQRFDFRPIAGAEIGEALRRILEEEKVPADAVEPDALRLLARAADGSLRDALSLLDTALAYGEGRVGARTVEELLGSGGAEAAWALAGALVRRAAPDALQRIADASVSGLDLALLCQETMELLRRALLVTLTGTPGPDATQDEMARLATLGSEAGASEADLLLLLRGLLDAETEMRRSPHARVDLEIAVVRLCHRPQAVSIETVLERLEEAEARLRGYGGPPEPAGPVQSDLLGGPAEPVLPRPVAVPRPVERATAPSPRGASRDTTPAGRDIPAPARPPGPPAPRSGAETWASIVAEVIRIRPTLGHLLSEGVVVGEEDGRLIVSVPNGSAFAHDQLRRPENKELVLEAARRLQPGLRDIAFTAGGAPGGVPAGTHPVVQAAMELFEGEITQVRAAPGPRASASAEPASGGEAP
ncbi:MAG: DNA polymerase III subunit gamma/tau [Candidatus Rokubacteria bacterium]|nr:DNA polymerase III subunit gamma/tau [Candidatus Rokubacteria bacterium]